MLDGSYSEGLGFGRSAQPVPIAAWTSVGPVVTIGSVSAGVTVAGGAVVGAGGTVVDLGFTAFRRQPRTTLDLPSLRTTLENHCGALPAAQDRSRVADGGLRTRGRHHDHREERYFGEAFFSSTSKSTVWPGNSGG